MGVLALRSVDLIVETGGSPVWHTDDQGLTSRSDTRAAYPYGRTAVLNRCSLNIQKKRQNFEVRVEATGH